MLSASLASTLRARFGLEEFRPGQLPAIEHLLAGRHTLVVMPTGAGKSLIYQLASLHLPGLTLVISPLVALMKDQVDSLARRGIPSTFINSTLGSPEQESRLRAAAEGSVRLLYVAPERLRHVRFREVLSRIRVGLLAVDEAHCVSQWGHDFRPDYLHLGDARAALGAPVTVALTATATPRVQDDIVRLLGLDPAERIVTGFNRPNLTFEVRSTSSNSAKQRMLAELLSHREDGAAIVYTGTRAETEEVAEVLRTVAGVPAEPYHAGMAAETRARLQADFSAGRLSVIVATNAFGMGIDRADVRLVVHFTLPGTLEAYYQEAGRAGRDGRPARAVLLYSPRDRSLQEWFIENSAPSVMELRDLFEGLHSTAERGAWATLDDLCQRCGLTEVKAKVALAQLERAGGVQRLGDDGPRMWLRRGVWDEPAMQAATRAGAEHRRHRQDQLARMIAYAETDGCRRHLLLEHFGDRAAAVAPRCCDNCLAPAADPAAVATRAVDDLTDQDRIALAILDCVQRLPWEVGRRKLADLLKGARTEDMERPGYARFPYYGRLAGYSRRQIEDLIDQLTASGHLKTVGAPRPVLQLTPRGRSALAARSSIPLAFPPARPERRRTRQAPSHQGDSADLTIQLFAEGLPPAQIATRRALTSTTIYTHLARAIAAGRLPLEAVVPTGTVDTIRAAIVAVGDSSRLAPIKARLPAEVSYNEIRCVVAAWQREQDGQR